ncbi:Kynurenine formamidase [Candidatus Lokiarchaeum ossiferum]|uniref:Kynurenine formamidase n=1 Tax=Candidatus Lokiarchaeum ossiferum TaxID=2951803 RepID=A0ABY6HY39_9ARCH|nr:Kynurenine formamidase [Candidatus Lokiarchaeum sp. B-35]
MDPHSLIDISIPLKKSMIHYPGDTPFHSEKDAEISDKCAYNLSKIHMSVHSGTHIDFPRHFIKNGLMSQDFSVDRFHIPICVIEISNEESIQRKAIENLDDSECQGILFKTRNSRKNLLLREEFYETYTYLSEEAAEFCVKKKFQLLGIDYLSIEQFGNIAFPIHKLLLKANILILEGINLHEVKPGKYWLSCFPLALENVEAAPVRAILFPRE